MGLDFRRGAELFMGRPEELARALAIEPKMLDEHRRNPSRVPPELLGRLAEVLEERGRAMVRVAEMLRDDLGPEGNGATGR